MSRIVRGMPFAVITMALLGLPRTAGSEFSAATWVPEYSVSRSVPSTKSMFGMSADQIRHMQFAPEPQSMALFGFALLGIGTVLKRRLRKA